MATPVEVTVLARRYGTAAGPGAPASVRVAPTQLLFADEPGPLFERWPTVPILAAALDVAQDGARGRQILDEWAVPNAVWR